MCLSEVQSIVVLADILISAFFILGYMRRVLVIFLIFLFPLHVFAESLDRPLALHTEKSDILIASVGASSDTGYHTILDVAANYDHEPDEPPASADLNDSLIASVLPKSADCLACSTSAYIPFPDYLLCLPILKPPPLA